MTTTDKQHVKGELQRGTDTGTLTIAFAGFGAETSSFIRPIQKYILQRGDLLPIDYGDDFDPEAIVEFANSWVASNIVYNRTVLLGISMGGKLAWEVFQKLDTDLNRRLLLVDAPVSKYDLPRALRLSTGALSKMPNTGATNKLATKLAFPGLNPKKVPHLSKDEIEQIKTNVVAARERENITRMKAETDYINADNVKPYRGKFNWRHAAFIRSLQGDAVVLSNRAHKSWSLKLGTSLPLYKVDAEHAVFDQQPQLFGPVVGEALDQLIAAK